MQEDSLSKIVSIEKEITLSGRKFIVKPPTISDIAETNDFISKKKKEKRKEILLEKTQIMKDLPSDMPYEEKMKFLLEMFPQPTTLEQKMKIMESFPKDWDEKQKQKQLLIIMNERDGLEFEETLYLLWRLLNKKYKEITFEDVKEMVSLGDLEEVYKAISIDSEGSQVKNGK